MHDFNAKASTDLMDQNCDVQKRLIMVDVPEENLCLSQVNEPSASQFY